jgi:hypothetical protein
MELVKRLHHLTADEVYAFYGAIQHNLKRNGPYTGQTWLWQNPGEEES